MEDQRGVQERPRRVGDSLSAPLLNNWLFKESITLLEPNGAANVIFSSENLAENIDSRSYAETQEKLLRDEFPEFSQIDFEPMTIFGNHEGFMRRFEWTPPDGKRVTQLQLYAVINGRGYTATATALAKDFSEHELQIVEIVEGLLFK